MTKQSIERSSSHREGRAGGKKCGIPSLKLFYENRIQSIESKVN